VQSIYFYFGADKDCAGDDSTNSLANKERTLLI
jgi:hypothetical protein